MQRNSVEQARCLNGGRLGWSWPVRSSPKREGDQAIDGAGVSVRQASLTRRVTRAERSGGVHRAIGNNALKAVQLDAWLKRFHLFAPA